MPKLHEILAVEKDLEQSYNQNTQAIKGAFSTPDLFLGACRVLEMFNDLAPKAEPEQREMTTTVKRQLDELSEHASRYFDAVLQKEKTNQQATADIVLDGTTLASNIPATFLLGLESKLQTLLKTFLEIPTLLETVKWEKDPTRGDDVFVMSAPEVKFKTAKTFKHKILYEATQHHPAQIEKWEETENTGKYEISRWSGLMSIAEKSLLIRRTEKLLRAVKKARQRANTQEVEKCTIGDSLFAYLNQK